VIIQAIDPPCALRLFGDQARFLEQSKMAGHGWSADGQRIGNLTHGSASAAEHLDDLTTVGVT
jgi:hypothetical protein